MYIVFQGETLSNQRRFFEFIGALLFMRPYGNVAFSERIIFQESAP
jgi:hypothetical protein